LFDCASREKRETRDKDWNIGIQGESELE